LNIKVYVALKIGSILIRADDALLR